MRQVFTTQSCSNHWRNSGTRMRLLSEISLLPLLQLGWAKHSKGTVEPLKNWDPVVFLLWLLFQFISCFHLIQASVWSRNTLHEILQSPENYTKHLPEKYHQAASLNIFLSKCPDRAETVVWVTNGFKEISVSLTLFLSEIITSWSYQ